MESYYTTITQIRYYGQMPKAAGKTDDGVWGTGIDSKLWGEKLFTSAWELLLKTATEQPFDLSRKREPVHEALANMTLDVDSLYVFAKAWGFLDVDDMGDGRVVMRQDHVEPFQGLLQRAWGGERNAISEMARDVKARVDVHTKGVDIAVVDLWSLVRLSFLRDHRAERTRVCANPDCSSPYFLQQRKGQQYCTHKCAVLMNVRRFRERAAKAESQPKKKGAKK